MENEVCNKVLLNVYTAENLCNLLLVDGECGTCSVFCIKFSLVRSTVSCFVAPLV